MADDRNLRRVAGTAIVHMPPGMRVEMTMRSGALWTFVKEENDRVRVFLTVTGNERELRGVYEVDSSLSDGATADDYSFSLPDGAIASIDVVDAEGHRTRADLGGYEPREGDEWSTPVVDAMSVENYAPRIRVPESGWIDPVPYSTGADVHAAAVRFVTNAVGVAKFLRERRLKIWVKNGREFIPFVARFPVDITAVVRWVIATTDLDAPERLTWSAMVIPRTAEQRVDGWTKAGAVAKWIRDTYEIVTRRGGLITDAARRRFSNELSADMCRTLLPLTEDDAFLRRTGFAKRDVEEIRLMVTNWCLNPRGRVGQEILRAEYEKDFPDQPWEMPELGPAPAPEPEPEPVPVPVPKPRKPKPRPEKPLLTPPVKSLSSQSGRRRLWFEERPARLVPQRPAALLRPRPILQRTPVQQPVTQLRARPVAQRTSPPRLVAQRTSPQPAVTQLRMRPMRPMPHLQLRPMPRLRPRPRLAL